ELQASWQQSVREIKATETEIIAHHQNITGLREKQEKLQVITLPGLKQECDTASYQLTKMKSQADAIAIKSEAWIQEQTHLSQEISGIQKILNPQKTQQAQLNERKIQLEKQIDQQKLSLAQISPELVEKRELVTTVRREIKELTEQIQSLASELAAMEEEVSIAQETQNRLLREQREKQRELDKLEATQQAQQEIQGTYSTKLLLNSDLPGVHGLVVNLGQVAPPYQLALTIAAGGRLGYLVVEDDSVAAAGISLLKQEKAGRATFLPLNKIKPSRNLNLSNLRQAKGYINLAANLVTCESRYWSIFSYVFGNTIVFESLEDARAYLGQYRIVTLAGDLLETSGAMTGGSFSRRSGLSFGDSTTGGESQKLRSLRQRLSDIDRLVVNNSIKISDQSQAVKQLSIQLTEKKQILQREKSLILQQLEKEIERLNNEQQDLMVKSENNQNELLKVQQTLKKLMKIIPEQEEKLAKLQQKLVELETSHVNSQWQQIQNKIKTNETDLKLKEEKFQAAQKQQQELKEQINRITEKIAQQEKLITKEREKQRKNQAQQQQINKDLSQLSETITETEIKLKELSAKLGETKQQRDAKENKLKKLQQEQ
ncbi:MAG: chromosome segregation protein SMC, partial [Cyanobacteria bacterium J083]